MILDLELQETSMNKATTDNIVFAKGGVESMKPPLDSLAAAAFHIVFFLNLDNLKKHLLRLVEIELSVKFSPPFANTFSEKLRLCVILII